MPASESSNAESTDVGTVSDQPFCRETFLSSLDSWITPTERSFIRSHFPVPPDLDASSWQLLVDGAVQSSFGLAYDELTALSEREVVATLECAGNSRSYVMPPAEGLQFRHGAVSNARWKGVSVSVLLQRAGIRETATEVLFEGADFGDEEEGGRNLQLGYARSLPLEKALHPDTIVAYEMNGLPLESAHGYPLRLIVPSWYGMASVKWLRRIQVLEHPYEGFFQMRRYVYINEGGMKGVSWTPVTSLRVKSLITHPRHGEIIAPGQYTIRGLAWSGEGEIDAVEISIDGGNTWKKARLVNKSVPTAWRQWEFPWEGFQPGHFILKVRATDFAGNTQPATIRWNFRGYGNNGIHAIAVEVPDSKGAS